MTSASRCPGFVWGGMRSWQMDRGLLATVEIKYKRGDTERKAHFSSEKGQTLQLMVIYSEVEKEGGRNYECCSTNLWKLTLKDE